VVATDLLAFVYANLPAPPARVLEVGAGDGELARALADLGYEMLALDPEPTGANVRAMALGELDVRPASFDAAVAVTSLHHVDPLAESLRRLAEALKPGAPLLVDEFDVAAFDRRAAKWWLEQRHRLGTDEHATAEELVDEHRAHLHPVHRITEELVTRFEGCTPLRGAYLYRWGLDESLRTAEEALIARGALPAVGARLVARRRA
jgi:SAM-dependent methyltransferase